jgi:hypothetical protein
MSNTEFFLLGNVKATHISLERKKKVKWKKCVASNLLLMTTAEALKKKQNNPDTPVPTPCKQLKWAQMGYMRASRQLEK